MSPLLAPSRARVLLVDDDGSVCEVVTDILETEGYTVKTVPDGAAALEIGAFLRTVKACVAAT